MKGRLVVPYSLAWAVLVAAAGVGASGCTSNETSVGLDPEGPPAIKQVFVNSRSGTGLPFNDPLAAFGANNLVLIDGGDLVYGLQPDVGFCRFDDACPPPTPMMAGFPAGYTCNLDLRVCVAADGRQSGPGGASLVTDGIIFDSGAGGPIVQIVFKELLDPATVEQFACSCSVIVNTAANGNVTLGAGNCPGGKNFTTDLSCSDCPENPDTTDAEEGTCFDINSDGVFDLPTLLPGLVSITCPGTSYTYTSGDTTCARVTAAGVPAAVLPGGCDGFYDPSGNQVITIDNGYLGLGPRLYLYPGFAGPLPADSDCELTVSDTIKDKDGLALVAPTSAVRWHTEGVARIGSTPEGRALPTTETGDPPTAEIPIDEIDVNMNTPIAAASVAPDTITVTADGVAVVGTTELSADDPGMLVWTPSVAFVAGQRIVVTTGTGIEDLFGKPLASADSFEFDTVPAP